MCEIWKDIEEYEGYYKISSLGRVRSLLRKNSCNQFKYESILKLKKDKYGYLRCTLCVNNKRKYTTVHRLVVKAFICNTYHKSQVNHKNGIKVDNRLENLEWCTAKENKKHLINILGKNNKGENHNLAKLSARDIINIRLLLKIGVSRQKEIAALYNIDTSQVSSIKCRKTWRHIL